MVRLQAYKLLLKGFLTMEQKKKEQKTAQILYITIIMVLLIMAIAVGLVTAAGKRGRPRWRKATASLERT